MTHAPHTGEQIAERYDLEEIVGSGGMSTVFCAHDVQLDRRVAIKILHERFTDDVEYVERFRHEPWQVVAKDVAIADEQQPGWAVFHIGASLTWLAGTHYTGRDFRRL